MQETIEKTKKDIETILQSEEEHQDKKIDFILINPTTNETITIASDGYDSMIYFTPYTIDEKNKYVSVADWDFGFDQYFFQDLQKGYQIGYITDEIHYNLWNTLEEHYPENIEYKDGVQWYLQYCADNGITKKYLDKKLKLDTPDIMKYFKVLALHETMNYKGYVIDVDETNYDNPKESIVNIYKSKEDYEENNVNETISLCTIDLRQNIKEYIDDVYVYKNNNFEEDKKSFCTFILGYDILNNVLSKSSTLENNISYEFCNMMAQEFLKSNENDMKHNSIYEMLIKWVENNSEHIKESYKDFLFKTKVGKTRQLDDGMYVKDIGYRNNTESIALIERTLSDNTKDYIIAFSYEVTGKKINWGYGNYYGYNMKQAEEDFKKVLDGEYLSNVPKKEKKSNEQER